MEKINFKDIHKNSLSCSVMLPGGGIACAYELYGNMYYLGNDEGLICNYWDRDRKIEKFYANFFVFDNVDYPNLKWTKKDIKISMIVEYRRATSRNDVDFDSVSDVFPYAVRPINPRNKTIIINQTCANRLALLYGNMRMADFFYQAQRSL